MEQDTMLTISSIGAIIAAIGAVIAAFGAWRSASETRKAAQAQIVIKITSTYSSTEMFESVKRLHNFKRKWEPEFGEVFKQLLQNKNVDPDYITQVDTDRRRVSHFFYQVKVLLDCCVVDENFVKKLIKPDQVETLLDVVEPLEKAKNTDYDYSTFDTFRKIYHTDC